MPSKLQSEATISTIASSIEKSSALVDLDKLNIDLLKLDPKIVDTFKSETRLKEDKFGPQSDKGGYPCPFCEKRFPKFQQLGGHKSKSHPMMSLSYARKQEIREQRKGARDVLEHAKKIYYQRHEALGSHI